MTLTGMHGAKYTLYPTPVGGEGDIHRISGAAGTAAKIHRNGMAHEMEEKLRTMALVPQSGVLDVLYGDDGRCAGFVMPERDIGARRQETAQAEPAAGPAPPAHRGPAVQPKPRGVWKYVLASVLGTAAALALMLHVALPGGLGGLFDYRDDGNRESPGSHAQGRDPVQAVQPTPGAQETPGTAEAPAEPPVAAPPAPTPGPDAPDPDIAETPPAPGPGAHREPESDAVQTIQFGPYEWRVLEVRGGQALVIADSVIAARSYHGAWENVTWAASSLRRWLNGEFLGTFSQQEQARIVAAAVANSNNPWNWAEWGGHASTPGGSDTQDMVFLLSIDEVLRYFGDSGLVAEGAGMGANARTAMSPGLPNHGVLESGIHDRYSDDRIARALDGSVSRWWLRSPGMTAGNVAFVDSAGNIRLDGFQAWSHAGVRPAMWLNLE